MSDRITIDILIICGLFVLFSPFILLKDATQDFPLFKEWLIDIRGKQ